jgi:selenocysteine lyase/cysteine desulfurase
MVEDASNYDRRDWQVARSARRFECGSPNMLGIHALDASLSLLEEIGIETIERRVLERTQHLVETIRSHAELELITAPERLAGIVTFRHRRLAHDALFARLKGNDVVCAARGGGIRFSPHFHTPLERLDQAVAIAAA